MTTGSTTRSRKGLRSTALLFVVLLVACMTAVAVRDHHHHGLSPVDEMEHLDYVDRAGHLGFVSSGDLLGRQTRGTVSCRGVEVVHIQVGRCGEVLPEASYPVGGYNTADIHPPVYYGITAVLQRTIRILGGPADLLEASRLAGGIWFAAGLLALIALCRELGASRTATAGVTLLFASSPLVLQLQGSVNVDASTPLFAAALILLSVRWLRGASPTWQVAAVGTLAMLTKATHLLAVVIAVAVMVLATPRSRRIGALRPAAIVAGAGAGGQILWLVVKRLAAHTHGDNALTVSQHIKSLPLKDLTSQVFAFLRPLDGAVDPTPAAATWLAGVAMVTALLVAAGPLMSCFSRDVSPPIRALGVGTAVATFVCPALIVIGTYEAQHAFSALPARYGMSLVPPALACLAALASRGGSRALLVLGAFSALVGWAALINGVV